MRTEPRIEGCERVPDPSRPSSFADDARAVMVIGVALAAAFAVCLYLAIKGSDAAIVGAVLIATLAPVGLYVSRLLARAREEQERRLSDLHDALRDLRETATLPDATRRVLSRRRQREILSGAIEEEIASKNWDAAMLLVRDLGESEGYRVEAEEFRKRIEEARRESMDRAVTEAIAVLDALIGEARFDEAQAEAAKIRRLFPDSPRSEGLRERVEAARLEFRRDLERKFLIAAEEERMEDAMDLLQRLDAFLTPQEAEPLREVVRGVIGKARENLGAQFKLAVQDRRWAEAVRLGEQIIEQFPNSRMAMEVRDVIDGVRVRAGML